MNSIRALNDRTKSHLLHAAAMLTVSAALCVTACFLFPSKASRTGVLADETDNSAEVDVVNPNDDGSGASSVLYDINYGLPTSEANTVLVSREGSVWIGSYSGLIRYDGETFSRIEGNSSIVSVISLFEDSKGRIWVGTNDSGVAVLIDWEFKVFNRADGLKSLSVRDITEDSQGNIYLATTEGLYYVDNEMNINKVESPKLENAYVRSIKTGVNDTIYGVTLDDAVFTVREGKLAHYYDVSDIVDEHVRAVLQDPLDANLVYVGTEGEVLYHGALTDNGFEKIGEIETWSLRYVNSIDYVGGKIWVCGNTGFGYVEDDRYHPVKNSPMTEAIEKVTIDYLGNLWFASSKQGVMKIVPNYFTDIYWQYRLKEEVVNATCVYNGDLYVGTNKSGIRVLSNGTALKYVPVKTWIKEGVSQTGDRNLIDLLAGCRIRSISEDSEGNLWICTFNENVGLIKFKGDTLTYFTEKDGLPSDRIRTIDEIAPGKYVICCRGGLAVMENDKITRVYNENDGITNTEILNCCGFKDGEILIGTDGGGIFCLKDGKITPIGVEDGLSSEIILRIKKDISRPIVWIVTSNSLGYMTEDHKITVLDKFPYSNNFDVYENTLDEMWVVSSNGLYVAKVEDLLDGGDINALFYGNDNGLQCLPNSNSYSALTDEGDLYLAGTTGVSKINIDKEYMNVSDFKLSIPYILADGEKIMPDKEGLFTVPSDTNKISIPINVYNYSLMNPYVSYMMEGIDRIETRLKRSELAPVDYTNLKGGTYTFTIKINDPRDLSNKTDNIVIVKEKSFLEETWVRFLFVALMLCLILIFVDIFTNYKTRKYKEKEEKQRILIREMVEAFAKMIDMKDRYTNGHSTRVAQFTALLTRELGYDEDTVEKNYNIALLHDIGKIGIPPEVLNKDSRLTDEEYEIIKSHSTKGYEALKDISIMPELATGAGCHHERPDGKGYPKGLKGDEIPRVAQIIAVADTFDAMYSDRPYRKHMGFKKVLGIMKEARDTQLQGDVVDAFLSLVEKGEIKPFDDDTDV